MKRFNLFIALSFCLFTVAFSQGGGSCYQSFLQQGIIDYNRLQFAEAIENFKAAIICRDRPGDLSEVTGWLEKSQTGFFDEIQRQKQRVEMALAEAERERNAADSARVIAEANRLALLAGNAMEAQRDTNALILAYSAARLMGDQPVPGPIKNAFGQAGHRFFAEDHNIESGPIFSILSLPDRPAVIIESGQGGLSILPAGTMESRQIGRHPAYLSQLQYDARQQKLLSTGVDGSIKVWDIDAGTSIDYPAHQREVTGAVFSQEGPSFVTVSKDQSGKLWDLNGQLKEQLPAQRGVPLDLQVASNGNFLTRSSQGEIIVWGATGNKLVQLPAPQAYIYQAVLSPDGQKVLTAATNNTAKLWNLQGQEVATLGHNAAVRAATFAPDGDRILTQTTGSVARIWDAEGRSVTTLDAHRAPLTFSRFSPSGKFILTGAKDNTVKVWTADGQLLHSLSHESSPIDAFFSPDEALILTTAQNTNSKLWDLQGDLLRTIDLQGASTVPSVFSSDGKYIIAVTDDQTVSVGPVPSFAEDIIIREKPISPTHIRAAEQEYGISIRPYWPE